MGMARTSALWACNTSFAKGLYRAPSQTRRNGARPPSIRGKNRTQIFALDPKESAREAKHSRAKGAAMARTSALWACNTSEVLRISQKERSEWFERSVFKRVQRHT